MLKPAANNKHDFTTRRSRTHRDVFVNDVVIRLCVHKNIGGFKFGDLVAHRQAAKLNVLLRESGGSAQRNTWELQGITAIVLFHPKLE